MTGNKFQVTTQSGSQYYFQKNEDGSMSLLHKMREYRIHASDVERVLSDIEVGKGLKIDVLHQLNMQTCKEAEDYTFIHSTPVVEILIY